MKKFFRPTLEILEDRITPVNPPVTIGVIYGSGATGAMTFYGSYKPGAQVWLVNSLGTQNDRIGCDANGDWRYVPPGGTSQSYTEFVTAGDDASNTANLTTAHGANPLIANFGAFERGNTTTWDIVGDVTDGNFTAAGLWVHITGSPVTVYNGGLGRDVQCDANGHFDLVLTMTGRSNDNGNIQATTLDAWEYLSNDPITTIIQPNT